MSQTTDRSAQLTVGLIALLAQLLLPLVSAAQSAQPIALPGAPESNPGVEEQSTDSKDFEKRWFVFGGLTNYQTRLEESEKQIDAEINDLFGKVIPRWKKPITFKDWSDDLKLWDAWIGVGRDISPRWNWFVDVGGGAGTIKNSEWYYPLLIPLKVDVDFTRTELFAEAGTDFYPWGKPENSSEQQAGSGLMRSLRATRPYFSLAVGYNRQTAIGDVRIDRPFIDRIARIKDEEAYDLLYVNPRISIEMPLTQRDSINFTAGYAFFDQHPDEFNSFASGVFFKHKF